MENKIIELVKKICNIKSTNCRSLNKKDLARELMNFASIPENAKIQEIPLDWNNQVVILFLVSGDINYYSLFAGIGTDGNFYFELSITGRLINNEEFDFFKEEEILPIDYFKSVYKKENKIMKKENEIKEQVQEKTLNIMCKNCKCLGVDCKGSIEQVWTGCIYKK